MKVLITEKLSEHRYKTPEGYLVCVDAILARTGKQFYKHSQVYDGSTDDITDVEVDRKPEQVFSPQAIASFENKPLTIQHPNEPVTTANHKDFTSIPPSKSILNDLTNNSLSHSNPELTIPSESIYGGFPITTSNPSLISNIHSGSKKSEEVFWL